MIRRTVTALTLAAVATIALASASPAMAAAPSGGAGVPTETLGGGTCTIDTAFGSIPCPGFDWSLGGLTGSEAESDESVAVGGTVSNAPIEVVAPRDDLADTFMPRIDLLPSPTASAEEEADATSVGDGLVEVVRPSPGELSDALDAVLTSPTPESSEPAAPRNEPSPPVDEATEPIEPAGDDTFEVAEPAEAPVITVPQTSTTTTTPVAVAETTTTTAANPSEINDETAESEALPPAPDASDDLDPMAAMLVGMVGTVMVAGLGASAYKFGQRGQ